MFPWIEVMLFWKKLKLHKVNSLGISRFLDFVHLLVF
jgi:hypothetical protein